jgi:polyhydroxybutyrate depolymerase
LIVNEWLTRRRAVLSAVTGMLSGCLAPAHDLVEDPTEHTLSHDGRSRRYRLVTPDAEGPHPTLLVLHGGRGNPERIARSTGFDAAGPDAGVAVVYPAGIGGVWNDGRESGNEATEEGIDDVGFLEAVVRDLVEEGTADSTSLACTGISNGAMMTHRFLIESAVELTAAASVAGSIPPTIDGVPDEPVPVLLVHGTADPLVPYGGGEVGFTGGRGSVLPAEAAVQRFVDANGCDPEPTVSTQNDHRDGTHLETRWYDGPAPVVHHVIHGGGHLWPGSRDSLIDLATGARSRELDATATVLNFFDSAVP